MKIQYKALVIDTILKEIRSKTLIFIFIATTLSIVLANLVLGVMTNTVGSDFNISGINIITVNFRILNSINFIVAAIFGVSVLRSDFENNIIYQYLTFPISRIEYFFVRVLGTWLLVMSYYTYSYLLSAILFSFSFKKIVFTGAHFYSFLILSVYLLFAIFISIFYSLFMNKIGALFMTFCSCMAAAASYTAFYADPVRETFQNLSFMKVIGLFIYYLFPRISFLDGIASDVLLGTPTSANIGAQCIHLLVISAVYVYLASYLIKRKDF